MKDPIKNAPGMDWALAAGILFWMAVIVTFTTVISAGRIIIPQPDLEISAASASRNNLIIAHQGGDAVRFANTHCIWTPDLLHPEVTEEGGALVLLGKEIKQGRVSKLEPGERAQLENEISMTAGKVGAIQVLDRMSREPIFRQQVRMTE